MFTIIMLLDSLHTLCQHLLSTVNQALGIAKEASVLYKMERDIGMADYDETYIPCSVYLVQVC